MKPFLSSDSKVDAIGFIDREQQESSYNTLSLIKHL